MKKIKVEVCFGTTCHIMGGAELLDLEEQLSKEIAPLVDFRGIPCLDFCKEQNFGKAPFVKVDGEVYGEVTLDKLLALIEERAEKITS